LDEERAQRSDKALAAMAVEAALFFEFAVAVADVNGIVPEKTPTIGMINEHPQSDHMLKS
jgi:hypothetical protein